MRALSLLIPAALVATLAACSDADYAPSDLSDTGDQGVDDDDGDTAAGDPSDSDGTETPRYWSVRGRVVVTEGIPERPELTLGLWTAEPALLCETDPATTLVTGWVPVDPPADVPLLAWWEVTMDATSETACVGAYDTTFRIGVGASDDRLDPALQAGGYAPGTVYGLYLQTDPSAPVWVFGAAWTDANRAGVEDLASSAPLPDGAYTLDGLHLLPL